MTERTDPNDWGEMWAWIDGEWKLVRKMFEMYGGPLIVEDYEHPIELYTVEVADLRRGDKPTTPLEGKP